METAICPKCNQPNETDDSYCNHCGVIFSKIKPQKKHIVKKPGPQSKKVFTSSERINKQLANLGDIDTWYTKKEIKHLPEVLRPDEVIKGLGSGTLDGNTWLIVVTNHRLLFLDKGMLFGLKQTEMHYEQISAISHKMGLLLASITISTSGGKKEIRHIQKADAPKLAELISDLIRKSKQPTTPATIVKQVTDTQENDVISQLERLGSLLEKGILTKEEFQSQKQKLLNP